MGDFYKTKLLVQLNAAFICRINARNNSMHSQLSLMHLSMAA